MNVDIEDKKTELLEIRRQKLNTTFR
jgi:hypothetical protein